jgi:hypothetical protein
MAARVMRAQHSAMDALATKDDLKAQLKEQVRDERKQTKGNESKKREAKAKKGKRKQKKGNESKKRETKAKK